MQPSDINWYILNYINPSASGRTSAEAIVERFNASTGAGLEIFAPTFVEMVNNNGAVKRKEKPLLFHYIFLKGTLEEVKHLCSLSNGFSFVMNRAGSTRYLTISPEALESFKTIARFYGNQIPCYASGEIDMQDGDVVEVVAGDFAGLKGTFISRKGARSGNIIISVTQSLAAVVYEIKADYVRVLEFARDSKRAYDQIEAFIPKLFAAMRLYHAGEKMDANVVGPLVVFSRRFESVKLNNDKAYAKMLVLLLTANKILGNDTGYRDAHERYAKVSSGITNVWTKALASLLISVTERDSNMFASGLQSISSIKEKDSKSQAMIRAEYQHYASSISIS